jgi:hypothetical protein
MLESYGKNLCTTNSAQAAAVQTRSAACSVASIWVTTFAACTADLCNCRTKWAFARNSAGHSASAGVAGCLSGSMLPSCMHSCLFCHMDVEACRRPVRCGTVCLESELLHSKPKLLHIVWKHISGATLRLSAPSDNHTTIPSLPSALILRDASSLMQSAGDTAQM